MTIYELNLIINDCYLEFDELSIFYFFFKIVMFDEYSKYKDFYSQLYQKVKKFIKIFLDKQYDMIDIAQL